MNTLTKRKLRSKPGRSVRVMLPLEPAGGAGVLRLTVGDEVTEYLTRRIGSDFGDGFRLDKLGSDDSYAVNLSNEGHTCDCKGNLRWGHCKHVDCLVALREGELI